LVTGFAFFFGGSSGEGDALRFFEPFLASERSQLPCGVVGQHGTFGLLPTFASFFTTGSYCSTLILDCYQ
jgi:hypothetical protein